MDVPFFSFFTRGPRLCHDSRCHRYRPLDRISNGRMRDWGENRTSDETTSRTRAWRRTTNNCETSGSETQESGTNGPRTGGFRARRRSSGRPLSERISSERCRSTQPRKNWRGRGDGGDFLNQLLSQFWLLFQGPRAPNDAEAPTAATFASGARTLLGIFRF
jgi:hypothetical protein